MKLQDLCDDLFGYILDYLDLENINLFLDCSSELDNYKNYFYCIILDEEESEKYYLDEVYRKEIDYKLEKKLIKKLSLYFFDLKNIYDFTFLNNTYCLILDYLDIKDVSALSNVHILKIIECHDIKDVSALGNVHTLTFENCRGIKNISGLNNVHKLILIYQNNINIMSNLCNIHNLILIRTSINEKNLENLDNIYLKEYQNIRFL